MIFYLLLRREWAGGRPDRVAVPGEEGFVHCCDERQIVAAPQLRADQAGAPEPYSPLGDPRFSRVRDATTGDPRHRFAGACRGCVPTR